MTTNCAIQIAREIAALARADGIDSITTMQLQKLLYHCQALAYHDNGSAIFCERVKAWEDGPVIPDIYHRFKGQMWVSTSVDELSKPSELGSDDREIVLAVWEKYKHLTGNELSELSHRDPAWIDARGGFTGSNWSPAMDHEKMAARVRSESLEIEERFSRRIAECDRE